MNTVSDEIDIEAPVREVYDQWTQFEDFPEFMAGVEEVRQLDDRTLHWRVRVAGAEREFDAVITEQVPDRRIAWASTTGPQQAGVVSFEPLQDGSTRVNLRLEWDPDGFVEQTGAALGLDDAMVAKDLMDFARFLRERGGATGAWRGSIGTSADSPDVVDATGTTTEVGDVGAVDLGDPSPGRPPLQ